MAEAADEAEVEEAEEEEEEEDEAAPISKGSPQKRKAQNELSN